MGRLFRFRIPLLCCLLAASAPTGAAAQCADWAVAVANVQPSSCFASGSFTVELSGSRLDSLSGIRYSLPGVAAYAQGQTSPSFTNMPQGTYTVLVEAMCGAANVAKSAQVAVAGSYTPPTCAVATARNSLGCAGGYGKISVSMGGSSTPRTVKLLSAPAAYAGATAFTTSATSYVLADLPAGEYLIQVVDNCGQSTATQPVSIRALDFSKLTEALNSLYLYYPFYPTWQPACNTYYLTYPSLNTSAGANPEWIGYDDYDTPIRWQVGFVGQPLCAPKPLNGYGASYYELLALPAGKTFKDYYGVDFAASPFLEAYVTSPCGSSWQLPAAKFQTAYATGAAPVVTTTATAFCGRGFCWNFELSYYLSIACYPISIRIASAGAGAAALVDSIVGITSFGTYTTGTLPFGDYLAYITTADGQTFTKAIAQADAAGNPYVGTFANGVSSGLSGRAYSIAFHRRDSSAFPAGTTIELVDTLDAAGYGYTLTLSSNYHGNTVTLYANDGSYDPAQGQYAYPQVAHFPPGRYYFRISDGCGQYALEATAADSDVYRYSISLRDTAISCQGLVVKPTGTAARGASTYAPYFKIICGPGGYDQPTGYDQRIIGEADSFILQAPGTYIIMVAAAKSASYYNMGSLGNSLVVCDTVVYEEATVALDMQATQGFVCIGAGDSEGQIVARATGGTAPYRYALYPSQEAALTGTGLIAENATGAFASTLGLRRSATYYLMLTDACSRQSLQSIRVLNLSSGMLAWADKATLCLGEAIALHAVTMPSTRYAWEGPNGFTSAAKDTVLPSAERAHAGSYRVRLSSTACPSAMESTPIAIAVRRYATAADIALDSFALCRGELLRLPLPPRGDHPAVRWYASQSANDAPIDVGSWLVVADTSLYVSLESDTLCENPAGARKRVRCTVKPQAYTALRDTTCQGQPYTGHGFALPPQDTSGVHLRTLHTTFGCDSTVALHLTVHPAPTTTLRDDLCQGQPYAAYGFALPPQGTSGVHRRTLHTTLGCDSTVALHLTVHPARDTALRDTACRGEAYAAHGFALPPQAASGVHRRTLRTAFGCDSAVSLHLTVSEAPAFTVASPAACADQPEVLVEYRLQAGSAASRYDLAFDQPQPFFADVAGAPLGALAGAVALPTPAGLRPDVYRAAMALSLGRCRSAAQPFSITVRYPAATVAQKWNNVLALYSAPYNGGYEFAAYQWLKNGEELAGATLPYLYAPPALDFGAAYSVLLLRADGVLLPTCPLTPQRRPEAAAAYPTAVARGGALTLRAAAAGEAVVRSLAGGVVRRQRFGAGAATLTAPREAGLYVVELRVDGEPVAVVKLLVQ